MRLQRHATLTISTVKSVLVANIAFVVATSLGKLRLKNFVLFVPHGKNFFGLQAVVLTWLVEYEYIAQ